MKNINMNSSFLTNMMSRMESIASSKDDVLNKKDVKELIDLVIKQNISYSSDKKEMQKTAVKSYLSFINRLEDEIFESIGVNFKFKSIEKVALYAKYGKNVTVGEFTKKIKKFDELLFQDLIVQENYINLCIQMIFSSSTEYVDNDENSVKVFMKQVLLLKGTIEVIKCIRYNYITYDIDYFDTNNKPKKVFNNKHLFIANDGFYCINKHYINIENIAHYLDERYFKENKVLSIKEMVSALYEYFTWIRFNIDKVNDAYNKLILGEKYLEYAGNRTTNILDTLKHIIPLDIFFHRKVLMPKSGVMLLLQDDDCIEAILLKEIFKFEVNHFVIITRFKDGTELVNSIPLVKSKLNRAIYMFYKEENNFNSLNYVTHFFTGTAKYTPDKELKYEVISPQYWKYRNRGYKSDNDEINLKGMVVKREFEIEIAPFIRKINGEASKEAKDLADKLGLILEKGYTIVKPHTRTYNKQK